MDNVIAVIDYGAGNLRNVCKALEHVGAKLTLTDDPRALERAEKLVLPGVGAFADCQQGLKARGLFEPLRDLALAGKPLLGICVGMQLLFEVGEEMGEWEGLGLIAGRVVRFDHARRNLAPLKVPHIGWNQLWLKQAERTGAFTNRGNPEARRSKWKTSPACGGIRRGHSTKP